MIIKVPHFGLIDENLAEEEKWLLRARLHVRGGKIRIKRGDISNGIAALYDAFISALYWYFSSKGRIKSIHVNEKHDLSDEKVLYELLVNSRILQCEFNFDEFKEVADKALKLELDAMDHKILKKI